jgi:hypothetical protein
MLSGLIAGALLLGTAAYAQNEPKGVVNKRQENQKDRIKAGVQDGSLTAKEAARLAAREKAIQAQEMRDRLDGRGYTAKEKARTNKRLSNVSKDIAKQRHDGQTK